MLGREPGPGLGLVDRRRMAAEAAAAAGRPGRRPRPVACPWASWASPTSRWWRWRRRSPERPACWSWTSRPPPSSEPRSPSCSRPSRGSPRTASAVVYISHRLEEVAADRPPGHRPARRPARGHPARGGGRGPGAGPADGRPRGGRPLPRGAVAPGRGGAARRAAVPRPRAQATSAFSLRAGRWSAWPGCSGPGAPSWRARWPARTRPTRAGSSSRAARSRCAAPRDAIRLAAWACCPRTARRRAWCSASPCRRTSPCPARAGCRRLGVVDAAAEPSWPRRQVDDLRIKTPGLAAARGPA